MAPPSRLKILAVGGNPVSAFLSWRLNETQACDVTLVWRTAYERVSQYGIDFQSPDKFGVHRWKCRDVVRSPEDAASRGVAFDYVLLCVKALPDVYDLASIIESVVTPQHTCILVNTTNTIGIEKELEQRFPTNIVLSLVSGIEITQSSAHEFVHHGSSADIWVGPANTNKSIPESIQKDMADALSLTLATGDVDCHVSLNVKQQQYERMIGPIAFYPLSVLFETPSHTDLMQKVGVPEMVSDVIDELIQLAGAQGCTFSMDFKEKTIERMIAAQEPSTFYNDFVSKRPMEVETYLGQPVKLSLEHKIKAARIETIYALLHHINIVNQTKPASQPSPAIPDPTTSMAPVPPPRMSQPPPGRAPMGGYGGRGGRAPSNGVPPPGARRGPSGPGYRGPPNGFPRGPSMQGPGQLSRRGSFDEDNLDEFSHVVLYDDIPEGGVPANNYPEGMPQGASPSENALREREYMLRQREAQMRNQQMAMRRGGARRMSAQRRMDFDDDDDDFFDPSDPRLSRPRLPNPDMVDVQSMTASKKNRKAPSQFELREGMLAAESNGPRLGSMGGYRPFMNRNRTSTRLINEIPGLHDSIMNDPMLGYSSDRYGAVDRKHLGDESRANSMIGARPPDFSSNGGYPMPPGNRRASQSPGNPLSANPRGGRPSPPNEGYFGNGQNAGPMNGGYPQMNGGRPSPPGGIRSPAPRYPPGHSNGVQPQQVEQQAGRGEW